MSRNLLQRLVARTRVLTTVRHEARDASRLRPHVREARPRLALSVAFTIGLTAASASLFGQQIDITETGFRSSPSSRAAGADLAKVVGVARDRFGHVYVLDAKRRELFVFDSSGHFLYAAGRDGRGTAPFMAPTSAWIDSHNHLFVWDEGLRRIGEYLMLKDSLRIVRAATATINASSACMLGDKIYLFGYDAGHVVHELDWHGKAVRSFGDPFSADSGMAQKVLSRGKILCDPTNNRIVVGAEQVGNLRSYDAHGGLRWSIMLDQFHAVQVSTDGGGLSFRDPTGEGTDVIITVLAINPNLLLIQTGRLTRQSKSSNDFSTIVTRVLSQDRGVPVASNESLPRLLGNSATDVFTVLGTDFPELKSAKLTFHTK